MSSKGEEVAFRKMDKKMKSRLRKGETKENGGSVMLEIERGDIIETKVRKEKINKGKDCHEEGKNNVVRKKRRKKEKNKQGDDARMNAQSEVGSAEEIVENETASSMKKIQNTIIICKDAAEKAERKKRKREKRKNSSVGQDNSSGEILESFDEGQNDNLAEIVKRKKAKKQRISSNKDDEGAFSVLQKENARENVGGIPQQIMLDEYATNKLIEIERGDIFETKMRKKKDKGKKSGEVVEDTGKGDAYDVYTQNLNCVYGEDSNAIGIDDVVRKKKKNKKGDEARMIAEPEVGSAEEKPKEESVSSMKSNEEVLEERNIQNETSSWKGAAEKAQKKKKRKREKKLDMSNDCFGRVGNEDSSGEILEKFNEGQTDNLDYKVKKKKNIARSKDDEGVFSVPPTLPGENVTSKLDKKKKSKKITNLKDVVAVAHQDFSVQDSVDKNFKSHSNTNVPIKKEVELAKRKNKKAKSVESVSEDPTPSKTNKKVRFSGEVEVFNGEDNLVRGKWFTIEEDEIVKEAVWSYIADYDLGNEGLDMVLNCRKHPQVKGCWKEISAAIPYRPRSTVYNRAHILFRRSENRKWTEEEYEAILKHQQVHGNQWKALADELGKHHWHVRDAWCRVKLPYTRKGHWSQQEHQQLFDLVNADLQQKASEEKKSMHGMLRDNIAWSAISDRLSTRCKVSCFKKWYDQLTSSMVAQGIWANVDDYRLLGALYTADASCMEDVDWDNLLNDRSGEVCIKRWNQMVLHLSQHGNKSFAEQVEVLAHRYCPHLQEAREAWDSKPVVDSQ